MMEHPAVSVMFKGHIANLVDVEAVFERFLTLLLTKKTGRFFTCRDSNGAPEP